MTLSRSLILLASRASGFASPKDKAVNASVLLTCVPATANQILTLDPGAIIACHFNCPNAFLPLLPVLKAPRNWTVSCGPCCLVRPATSAYQGLPGSENDKPEISGSKLTLSAWSSSSEVGIVPDDADQG